jgi:hypothetical protein
VGYGGRNAPLAAEPRDTAPRPCCPAPRQQAPTAVPRGGRTIFNFQFFFIFRTLLTFLKTNKLISVSIITREYHNQGVYVNSLYKIMVKILLHLNVSVPLRPNSSSASPGVVTVVRQGVNCPDHPRSELVGRRCRSAGRRGRPPMAVSTESQSVPVSTVTDQTPRHIAGHLGRKNVA